MSGKIKRAFKAWLYQEGAVPVTNEPDPPPKYSAGKRFLAAAVGTFIVLLAVTVVISVALGDRSLSDRTIGFIQSCLLPIPFVFWKWPELVIGPLEQIGALLRAAPPVDKE